MGIPVERFWSKVSPEPNTGCWLWNGCDNGEGYGTLYFDRKSHKAHRVSYEMNVGPIPDGKQIDHLCRVRCCVNPDHLEAVTQAVNVQRGVAVEKCREWFKKITHCPHGHAYDERSVKKSGHRRCLVCHREKEKARYARRNRAA